MDASRTMPDGGSITAAMLTRRQGGPELGHYPYLPLDPLNGVSQKWLELWLPGALLQALMQWWIVERVLHIPPEDVPCAA